MKYKSVIISKRGGPEVLQVIENDFRKLANSEVLIKIQACAIGGTDISMRYYRYLFAPKIPFVPGYEIIGTIEGIGSDVNKVKVGDRVAALTVYGGYSEYIYLQQDHLVKVPETIDSAEAAVIVLNYTSAYQMLKKVAHVKDGDSILVTGSSGGVGTAFLDLAKMENLKVYGSVSAGKQEKLKQFGATYFDYKTADLFTSVLKEKPAGIKFVFDGIGGEYINKSLRILVPGGMLVEYGFLFKSASYFLKSLMALFSAPFKGVKSKFYGISVNYKKDKTEVLSDISQLFNLLENGKIHPLIYKKFPILEAAEANRIFESGQVCGNIVLVAE